ncbi:LacI family DNA-binding transcriptional regulator [Lentzea fradiae]|uniref:LacI family DNA-binding transcriptional regulator n=1 Tax=Lentzea fradiae TaxID=200378 RepID=UPI001FE03C31|nr:LacI family DNA-binding transcriptional regulator [Lentzea fradiae]
MARLAGVSIATASKAINDRGEVAATTRARVLRAAAELAFQPNPMAQGLVAGRTRAVGVLTDELDGQFTVPVLLGAEKALADLEMSVLLCDTRGDTIRRNHHIRTLLARQVDGFIVVGDSDDIRASLTAELPVPVVYVHCRSTGHGDLSLVPDDEGAVRLAVEHLLALRRRNIGHITGPQSCRAARDRAATTSAVLSEHGLTLAGGHALHGEWSQRWGRQAARLLIATAPETDAVFCGNDRIASGVAQELAGLGRRVPEDVAIVGYGNREIFAADCSPPLTTVDLGLPLLGEAAVAHLVAAMAGTPSSGVIRQPCRLVLRESTA